MMKLGDPLYKIVPKVTAGLDRWLPRLWLDWPEPFGGMPPQDIVSAYPRYKAVALAQRICSKRLQNDAFKVTPAILDAYIADRVVYDREQLQRFKEDGSILAVPHYGPFLGGALTLAALGSKESPSHVFYDPQEAVPENARFDAKFKEFSGRINVLHNEPRGIIKAGRALRRKQCVSIMFDVVQHPTECLYVPFFGRLHAAMGGAALLSILFNSPIIPAYTVPKEGRKIHLIFGEPILPGHYTSYDRDQNVFAMTCALFRDFERQLRQAPWHWVYWGNLARTATFNDDMVSSEQAVTDELRRRINTTPTLLRAAPVLESLLQAR